MITYKTHDAISVEQFIDVLERSTLGERRPLQDPECMKGMLAHTNLLVTAWAGDTLAGMARSVTDFHFCCYLSDLAVDRQFQRQGIGTNLIEQTRRALGPRCCLILLAAPAAEQYYPHLGFEQHGSAWYLPAGRAMFRNQGMR